MMGSFDTLSHGGHSAQVKCFRGMIQIYHMNERVPDLHYYDSYEAWPEEEQLESYTIVLPSYESMRFALIKDRTFVGFTNEVSETWKPYVAKWGEKLDKLEDFKDYFSDLVEEIKSQFTTKGDKNE